MYYSDKPLTHFQASILGSMVRGGVSFTGRTVTRERWMPLRQNGVSHSNPEQEIARTNPREAVEDFAY